MIVGVNTPTYELADVALLKASRSQAVRQSLTWPKRGLPGTYRAAGQKVISLLAREARDSHAGANWIEDYARECAADSWAVQIWNEHDGPHGGESAPLDIATLNQYATRTINAWRAINPQIKVIVSSSITGQPSAYAGVDLGGADGIGVHCYWKTAGEIRQFLQYYRDVLPSHVQIYVTEINLLPSTIVALGRIPWVPVTMVYCWLEWERWVQALLNLQHKPTERYTAFQATVAEVEVDELKQQVEALKAQVAELKSQNEKLKEQQRFQTALMERILLGNWDEGAGSAEALLRTLDPVKYKTFEAVRFPK